MISTSAMPFIDCTISETILARSGSTAMTRIPVPSGFRSKLISSTLSIHPLDHLDDLLDAIDMVDGDAELLREQSAFLRATAWSTRRKPSSTPRVMRAPAVPSSSSPAPMPMPMAAAAHRPAAVVRPLTRSSLRQMAPAPRNPIPVTICAATAARVALVESGH